MPVRRCCRLDRRARTDVTITCPSCATRYRQPPAAESALVTCACSRCEAVFPSDTRPKQYSVCRPESTGPGTGPVPTDAVLAVAARLEPVVPVMAPPMVLPAGGPVPGEAAGIADLPIGMDDPTLASKIRAKGFASPAESAPLAYSSEPAEEPEPDVEAEPSREEKKPARVRDTRPGFGAFMVVTCLPTAMAAGAWQLSTKFAEDPVIWTTPAAVLGLLFSWLWVRWKYRER